MKAIQRALVTVLSLAATMAFAAAGIAFIGPPASALDAMGEKTRARAYMVKAGVPVVPGAIEVPAESGARYFHPNPTCAPAVNSVKSLPQRSSIHTRWKVASRPIAVPAPGAGRGIENCGPNRTHAVLSSSDQLER